MKPAAIATLCAGLLAIPSGARAYEFEVAARTTAQAYQLRWLRFSERDRILHRRRFTQSLGLDVWGILEPPYDAYRSGEPPLAPFDLYVTTELRIDHDFGDWRSGSVIYPTGPGTSLEEAATSAVPELAGSDLALQVLAAAVGARGIGGAVDVALGRQLFVDSFDFYALDGLSVSVRTPWHLAVEAHGGLLVRDASPLGSATHEPDGSSSGQCVAIGPEGIFIAVDECGARQEPAPTFGVTLATHGLRWLSGRLSYRRSLSTTADGVVPDSADEAPSWGVLEEKVALSLRGNVGEGRLVPWIAARWNLLLGAIDEAHAGARVTFGDHALTPEARYSFPSFDGDSIFNVFSSEPFWDLRLAYDVWPGRGALRGTARAFWRRFQIDAADVAALAPGETVETAIIAAGGSLGARLTLGARATIRLEGFFEDGYGGLRAGGDLSGRVRLTRRLAAEGRASLIRFDEDSRPDLSATSFGAQAGAVLTLGPGMALSLLAEQNVNRIDRGLRLYAVLDLAFRPEH